MRQPKIGEMLKCGVCFSDCKPIDEAWIDYYNMLPSRNQRNLYDADEDVFLDYDYCEEPADNFNEGR